MQVRRVEERGGKIKYLQNLYVHRLWIDFFKKIENYHNLLTTYLEKVPWIV
jgi:hypothetical protein